jgi:hypothetical protein
MDPNAPMPILTPSIGVLVVAILCVLAVAAVVVAVLGRRAAPAELSRIAALRAAGRARTVGVAILAGRVESDDEERVVVKISYPSIDYVLDHGSYVAPNPCAVAVARRFWLATEQGAVAVEPLPGTFMVDAHDRPPYSTPATAGSTVTIADGAAVEVEGWLRRERGTELGFREAPPAWVIGASEGCKLRLTDRSLSLSVERRVGRWTLALVVAVVSMAAPAVLLWRAGRSVFEGEARPLPLEDLAPSAIALAIVAVMLCAAHIRGPDEPWIDG